MKEDVDQLRELIRKLGLIWLDDELDEIISAGKLRQKEIQEGKKKSLGVEQIAYSYSEQLDIIISTLRNYFVTLPLIELETSKALSDILNISNISFKKLDNLKFKRINNDTQKLESLLNQIKA